MTPDLLWRVALLLVALGCLVAGGGLLLRLRQQLRSGKTLDAALTARAMAQATEAAGGHHAGAVGDANGDVPEQRWLARAIALGTRWSESSWGEHLVAEEDRRVLDQCGWNDARGRALFVLARVGLAVLFPLIVWFWLHGSGGTGTLIRVLVAVGAGVMLPKLWVTRRARARREALIDELPLLIDLLRLLQGVGLSIDQCLHVIVGDFRHVLPVLAREFEIANRSYSTGRTREQSLVRLRDAYDNDDLRAVVKLIVQVEQHGGAVQEPLQQFSERLREQRRQTMKERIGRLTVKMTLVMMVTLLPALMMVIAGPALLSLLHTLGSLHR